MADGFDAAQAHYDSELPEDRLPNTHDPETGVELGEPWTEESIRAYAHKQETGVEMPSVVESLIERMANEEQPEAKGLAFRMMWKDDTLTEEERATAQEWIDNAEKWEDDHTDDAPITTPEQMAEKLGCQVAEVGEVLLAQMKTLSVALEKWGKDLQKQFAPPAPMNRAQRRAQKFNHKQLRGGR